MRRLVFTGLLLMLFLLAACSADPDAAEHYAQRKEVNVNIEVPDSIEADSVPRIDVLLTSDGKALDKEASVTFLVWKDDNKADADTIPASRNEEGSYQLEYKFASEGVYYVKADINVDNIHLMPTKQLRVGELTEAEKQKILQEQEQRKQKDSGGHHHH
ncbi:FixH family protein [Terribacillus sp. DMT04]|uniref:FixH family protein n=1 Tax=Terribacillus sp. DMT04 TaxID=2850441 RepID=UPI001C2C6797|nr:FixH family protein [Terribacillus sp. DMT04]QXE01650.1 FixH family protein [Terribacillus sp. DMT04]